MEKSNYIYKRGMIAFGNFDEKNDLYAHLIHRPLILISDINPIHNTVTVVTTGSRNRPGIHCALYSYRNKRYIGNNANSNIYPYIIHTINADLLYSNIGFIQDHILDAIDKCVAYHLGINTDYVPPYMEAYIKTYTEEDVIFNCPSPASLFNTPAVVEIPVPDEEAETDNVELTDTDEDEDSIEDETIHIVEPIRKPEPKIVLSDLNKDRYFEYPSVEGTEFKTISVNDNQNIWKLDDCDYNKSLTDNSFIAGFTKYYNPPLPNNKFSISGRIFNINRFNMMNWSNDNYRNNAVINKYLDEDDIHGILKTVDPLSIALIVGRKPALTFLRHKFGKENASRIKKIVKKNVSHIVDTILKHTNGKGVKFISLADAMFITVYIDKEASKGDKQLLENLYGYNVISDMYVIADRMCEQFDINFKDKRIWRD